MINSCINITIRVFVQTSADEREEHDVPHSFVGQVLEIYKVTIILSKFGFLKTKRSNTDSEAMITFSQCFDLRKSFFKSRVLDARGFNSAKENMKTTRMEDEIKQMRESLEKITELMEKK